MTSKILNSAEKNGVISPLGELLPGNIPVGGISVQTGGLGCGLRGHKGAMITSSVNLKTLLFKEVGDMSVMTAERYGRPEKITRYF